MYIPKQKEIGTPTMALSMGINRDKILCIDSNYCQLNL
jgi:hypothetical protein